MRVTKPLRTEDYLRGLAEFMNVAKPDVTEKQWRAFVQRMAKSTSPLNTYFTSLRLGTGKIEKVERISLKEACDARAEIHSALDFLRNKRQDDRPFAALIDALNDLELVTQYQCLPVTGKARPGAPILHAYGKRWQATLFPVTRTTKHLLYTILASALTNGALMRLKLCSHCKKYIAVEDTERRFCSIQCKDDFNNRRRLAEGYFRKNREMNRKKRKNRPRLQRIALGVGD